MNQFEIKPFDTVCRVMRKSYNSFQIKKRHASWKPFLLMKELLARNNAKELLAKSHY